MGLCSLISVVCPSLSLSAKSVQLCPHSSHFSAHVRALLSHPPLVYTNSTYITNLSVLLWPSQAGRASPYLSRVIAMPGLPHTAQILVFIFTAKRHTLCIKTHKRGKTERGIVGGRGWAYLPAQPKVVLCDVCRMRCRLSILVFVLSLINATSELCDARDAGKAKVPFMSL